MPTVIVQEHDSCDCVVSARGWATEETGLPGLLRYHNLLRPRRGITFFLLFACGLNCNAASIEEFFVECNGTTTFDNFMVVEGTEKKKLSNRYEEAKSFWVNRSAETGWVVADVSPTGINVGWANKKYKSGAFELTIKVEVNINQIRVQSIQLDHSIPDFYFKDMPFETERLDMGINRITGDIQMTQLFRRKAQVYAEAYEVSVRNFDGQCRKSSRKI